MATKRRSPARTQPRIRGGVIIAKPYNLLEDAIESGLKGGIRKVFKYWPTPAIKEDQILSDRNIDLILNYIMVDICERFDFPEYGGDSEHNHSDVDEGRDA